MKHLITIVGPTGIGKTALSIQLAQHFNCEILSADSRQFYSEMTIGTAVPDSAELALATHHFIQHKSIRQNYTVGDFEKEALSTLDKLFAKHNIAILVGGSGLYIDAVLKGLDTFPQVPENIRQLVSEQYAQCGIEYLQTQVQQLDPIYYQKVDTLNPQRLMRALEVCLASNLPYSSFLKGDSQKRTFIPIMIGLDAPREQMYDRINKRVDLMMQNKLLNEAQKLLESQHLNALQTVGYRELFSYFNNEITLEFAISEIKKNTRRFAKRQLTWFKRNPETRWFDYQTNIKEIVTFIEQKLQNQDK